MAKKCFIGLGSNAPTISNLQAAQTELRNQLPDIAFSCVLQTLPVNFDSPRPFFNQTAVCTTTLPADELRRLLKQTEQKCGRKPEDKAQGIVAIDLDLLWYDGKVLKPDDWQRNYIQQGIKELQ